MKSLSEPAYTVEIFIAGDYADARNSLRRQCYHDGLCVTIERIDYCYTAGLERGVRVGLRQYPRFPKSSESIRERAKVVALTLMDDLYQHSALICDGVTHEWLTRRPQDTAPPPNPNGN